MSPTETARSLAWAFSTKIRSCWNPGARHRFDCFRSSRTFYRKDTFGDISATRHVNPARDFPLLWLLGEAFPAPSSRDIPTATAPPGDDDEVVAPEIEADPGVLKFSLAGVQLKFSAIRDSESGLTIPVHGRGGTWITKLPSSTFSLVPENEYTMLAFARRVGIDVPEIGLIDSAEIANIPTGVRTDLGKAMYIERFDRAGDRRIHVEDFAQIFCQYPADKYKNVSYANMLRGIWQTMGQDQTKEFVRRLVFSMAIGNADMHLKNWSVIYPDGRTPKLAPAYDYVSTIAYIPDDKLALTIARTKEWRQITEDRLERFARRAAVPRGIVLDAAREMVDRVRTELPHLNDQDLIPRQFVDAIRAHISQIPFFSRRMMATGIETSREPPASSPAEIS